MGFLDKLADAAKLLEHMFADVPADGLSQRAPTHTPMRVYKTGDTPIAPYVKAEGCFFEGDKEGKYGFEVPSDFGYFDSHAEPELCHMYMLEEESDDMNFDQPIICLTCENFAYTAVKDFKETGTVYKAKEFEAVKVGKMLFRARMDYYDHQTVVFYGFEHGTDASPMALAMMYCKDVIDTPLEKKLLAVLDHAAQTYFEEI